MFEDLQHQVWSAIQSSGRERHHECDHSTFDHRVIELVTQDLLAPRLQVLFQFLTIRWLFWLVSHDLMKYTGINCLNTHDRLIRGMTISPLDVSLQCCFYDRELGIYSEERIAVLPISIDYAHGQLQAGDRLATYAYKKKGALWSGC